MNGTIVSALFEDAFRQVLDDKVFRLLVGLAIVLILPTFVVALTPDGISLLFGMKTWSYSDLGVPNVGPETHIQWIQGAQSIIVSNLAGTVGLLFCIAATAFFVPRMLEKGAADTLFSKPVGRFTLLIARFAAGVLFVAILSFLLVLGMHIGLSVTSGYSDPAFLWSALTLTYVFALVHSVSVTVAVLTRSSIAAILSTMLFFVFTGCIHQTWILTEHTRAVMEDAAVVGEEETPRAGGLQVLVNLLGVTHWVLPKTTDADYVVAGLRRTITEPEPSLRDTNGLVSVGASPKDFVREGAAVLDLGTTPALWLSRDAAGEEVARIRLSRRERESVESRDEGRHSLEPEARTPEAPSDAAAKSAPPQKPVKMRLRSASSYSTDFAKAIEKDATTASKPQRNTRPSSPAFSFSWVRWRVLGTDADVERVRGFSTVDVNLYEVEAAFQPSFGDADQREKALEQFHASLRIDRKSAAYMDPQAWYTQVFGWTSTWRHNAFVSIGTSILFALVMLLIARWRLARMDF